MNKDRRQQIRDLGPRITEVTRTLAALKDDVEQVRDEESEYLESLPENFKQAERGQIAEAAVASLDEALTAIDAVDTSAIAAALAEAADIDVPAETVEATVDRAEAERRRFERLPEWAKAELDRLAQQVETLNVKLAASLPEATGAPGEFVVGGYSGPMVGRRLPFDRIEVPSFDVEIYHEEGRNSLTIRARKGQVVVRPQVSNEVLIRGEPFWS